MRFELLQQGFEAKQTKQLWMVGVGRVVISSILHTYHFYCGNKYVKEIYRKTLKGIQSIGK